jgi:hypothetical protein
MSLLMKAAEAGEWLLYRIGGLPVALRATSRDDGSAPCDAIRQCYARSYWRPESAWGYVEIALAWLLWPFVLLVFALWLTAKNGKWIRRRHARALATQLADQVKLYFTDGLLPPWYYVFDLAEDPRHERAEAFLQRFESKGGIYPLLRRGVTSELNDKRLFADFCRDNDLPAVTYLMYLDGSGDPGVLPDQDLFVKLADGRGGRGAERWDRIGERLFCSGRGEQLNAGDLRDRLAARARSAPLIVQPRIEPHRDLLDLTTGALPTVRVTTCLDKKGAGEVVSAVFRMAIGENRTVDNLHAGGIASGVAIETGSLSRASNLGMDSRLGWLERHPDTGAMIACRTLPLWRETKALAVRAQSVFADRVLVGWDIAITDDGPVLVEGNSSPDLDIIQRFGEPVCTSRFGELLAWHLRERGFAG